jgi:PAS domain-containing protein
VNRVCAWCHKELPALPDDSDLTSHGICETCADTLISNNAVPLEQYLDKLPEPVLVVDSDVTVSFLNRAAQALTGKAPESALHRRGGEVFECVYAQHPEGCGRTIHCSGCAIRHAIATTHQTGEPNVVIPATLKKGDPDDPRSATLTITTVKRGDLVILRLDKVE